jgi:two-component system NtrC family sensor kinase
LTVKKAGAKRLARFSNLELDWKQGVFEACIQRREAILIANVTGQDGLGLPFLTEVQPTSLVCVPLMVADVAIGAAAVLRVEPPPFGSPERDLLAILAGPIAQALHQTGVLAQLKTANADLESSVWQLTRSRNTLRALFDSLPISIYIIDPQFNLVAINLDRSQRVNRPPTLLVGRPCYQALYQRDEVCSGCRVAETLAAARSTVRTQHSGEAGNDEPSEWEIHTYPIYDDHSQVIQAILIEQDITERHRLEAIVGQSEKLAAIGQLAAGVAHEINNPLTAILANAQLLQREIPAPDDKQELVGMILHAGSRAAQVVRSLLDLARLEQYEFLPTDVNETIHKALDLVRHEIVSHCIQLTTHFSEDLPLVRASQNHLQGVWVNLMVNAVDAMEDQSGELHISTRCFENEISVVISDTGKGIPADQLERIFDPFFTTKSRGHGTGLGLSVCDRTIKQHNGRIVVNSQVGVGTEFTVLLPVL